MFNMKRTNDKRILRTAFIVAAIMVFSVVVKLNTLAQENRFSGDHRYDDNRGGDFNRDDRDRGGFRDGNNSNLRLLKERSYSVNYVKENPAAFGAKLRYLNGDWDKKYLYWTPPQFNKQSMRPLVISLHGNDEEAADAFARLYDTITQYNYAFVAPKWKTGDKALTPEQISILIAGVLSELKEKEGLNFEPNRVILHGYERGANMAGYLDYYKPGKYIMVIVDSGPFPVISSASSTDKNLSIPANDLNKLSGSYIYLYSRYEDQAMYQELEKSKQILVAAGAKADLNYTKGLLPGALSKTLSKSMVDMFDRATAGK